MSTILDTLVTDRTGGYYNVSDLNRVGQALNYVKAQLTGCGFVIDWTAKTDWAMTDRPTPEQMENYLSYIENCRNAVNASPATPESMNNLTVDAANDIEKILVACGDAVDRLIRSLFYSGEVGCGEV